MARRKPTVYLDTNILSVLHYKGGNVSTLAWQIATRDWWDSERQHFQVFVSQVVEDELADGEYKGQEEALSQIRRLHYLPFVAEIKQCIEQFTRLKIVPETKEGDLFQLAYATAHKVDYLLTWNYAHLANVDTQRRLKELTERLGWRAPLLVSPENIPQARLGQTIWRNDE